MIELRPVTPADMEFVFNVRNIPDIVKLSSSQRFVTWDEHNRWYKQLLKRSADCRAFIVVKNEKDIGTLRFERNGSGADAVISIYLIPGFPGRGIGVTAINLGCERVFALWPNVRAVVAVVRRENEFGRRAFVKAKFVEEQNRATPSEYVLVRWRPLANSFDGRGAG